jgi:hypothetical protein
MMQQWEYAFVQFAKENPMKTNLTNSAQIVCMALTLILSACGASVPAATPTVMASVTNTATAAPTITPTVTFTPTRTPRPTATPNLAATQQYEDFFGVVQKIHNAGQISTTEGKYAQLSDFQDSVAGKLSYAWGDTGITAKNFVVQADFEWNNAIKTVNTSGCGFVYRLQPNKDHYLIILDAINGVKLASSTDRGTYSMGSPANGNGKVSDFGSGPYHATFTLIVNELKTYVYVNDIYYGEYKLLDYRITDSGPLGAAILSATDEGYGTRCKMTNIHAWVIEP